MKLFSINGLLGFFVCLTTVVVGQPIENIRATFDGENMLVVYDLNQREANQRFKIVLYSSHNGYTSPVTATFGDVGEAVSPGKSKRITWALKRDLPSDFDGDVTVKIRALPATAPLTTKALAKSVYRKGQTIDILWQGGKPSDKVLIELIQDGAVQQKVLENSTNNYRYQWKVPKGTKGKAYQLRISNGIDQTSSGNFYIKPKTPLFLIVGAAVVVTGAAALLSGSRSTEGNASQELPGPIKPN